jgi:hypothetical protein
MSHLLFYSGGCPAPFELFLYNYSSVSGLTNGVVPCAVGNRVAFKVLIQGVIRKDQLGKWGIWRTFSGPKSRPVRRKKKSRRWDSNPRHPLYESGALPLSYVGTGDLCGCFIKALSSPDNAFVGCVPELRGLSRRTL